MSLPLHRDRPTVSASNSDLAPQQHPLLVGCTASSLPTPETNKPFGLTEVHTNAGEHALWMDRGSHKYRWTTCLWINMVSHKYKWTTSPLDREDFLTDIGEYALWTDSFTEIQVNNMPFGLTVSHKYRWTTCPLDWQFYINAGEQHALWTEMASHKHRRTCPLGWHGYM